MTSKMEDDLKNGRQPQKWKTTPKMEDDLKNRKRPQKPDPQPQNDPPQCPCHPK